MSRAAAASWILAALPIAGAQEPGLDAALGELSRRAEALADATPRADDGFRDLVARVAAAADDSSRSPADLAVVLEHLAYAATLRRQVGHEVGGAAATLQRCYQTLDGRRPAPAWRQVDLRFWAECAFLAGDLQSALVAVHRALGEALASNAFETASAHVLAGRSHLLLGRLEAAGGALERARAAADRYVDAMPPAARAAANPLRYAIAMLQADLCLLGDDVDGAIAALEPVQRLGDAQVYLRLSRLLRGDRSQADALADIARHPRCAPDLRRLIGAKLAQAALLADDLAGARAHLDALAMDGDPGPDERTITLGLELALRSGSQPEAVLTGQVQAAWQAMLQHLRRAPRLRGGTGLLHVGDRATFAATALRAAAAAGGPERAFGRLVELHAAAAGIDDVDPARVRRELTATGQTLLAFVPGRFGTVLLCVTADRTSMHVIGPARPLRDAADRLRAAGDAAIEAAGGAAADRAFAAFTDRAAAVAPQVLPAEVRAHLASSRRLTIVGAGMLQNLPFDVLPLRIGDRGVPLGELLAVDYVANVAIAAECAPRRPLRRPPVLAAALRTARHGGVRAMPADIGRVVAPYDPKAVVHLDAAVAVPGLLDALEQAPIVHCIGHGDFDGNRIFEHAIRFTDHDDGLLSGDLVLERDLRGVVVVLGSCRAAEAPLRRGGDPLAASLAGAMLAAGARCVLVPSTDVQLGRHLDAGAALHAALAAGESPADALWAARRAIAATGDRAAALELLLVQMHGRGH